MRRERKKPCYLVSYVLTDPVRGIKFGNMFATGRLPGCTRRSRREPSPSPSPDEEHHLLHYEHEVFEDHGE